MCFETKKSRLLRKSIKKKRIKNNIVYRKTQRQNIRKGLLVKEWKKNICLGWKLKITWKCRREKKYILENHFTSAIVVLNADSLP